MLIVTIAILVSIPLIIFILFLLYSDKSRKALEGEFAQAPSEFIDIDGTRVHYRVEGNVKKPVLVLLHGVFSSLLLSFLDA